MTLAQIYTQLLIRNNSWELFLGTVRKIPGNNDKKFLGTKIYWRGPKLRKGGVPGNSWEQNLLTWSKMRVCATFPGTFPGTKCPSSWEPAHFSTSAMTGQRQFWGPDQTGKSFSGVWGFRLCIFDDVSCCRGGGGGQLQPQSSDLHNSCENHPPIMQVQQADLNVCRGNHFFSVPAQPQETLRRKFRNRQGKDGVLIFFCFCIVPKNSQIFLDLAWKFLS